MINRHSTPAVVAVFAVALFASHSAFAGQLNSKANVLDSVPPASTLKPALDATTQFVPSIDDLPLMPGLSPLRDEDTVFVVPHAGRIAESAAIGAVDVDEVYKYYNRSLPQLGWKPNGARTYSRNGEKLHILARANGKITTVQFSIKPE